MRHTLAGGVQLREHARVKQACDVEIGVGIAAQLDDGRDVIGVEEHRHLRLRVVDGGEHIGRRLAEDMTDLRVDLLDDVEVLVDQHHCRQSADRSLCGQELTELVARLVVERFRARKLDGGRNGIGARELRVLAHIGICHDERVLDERMRLLREQAIEPAVERHACHHRDQDRRCGGDDREQRHDPHVQARGGTATTPSLDDPPHLAADQADQQRDGHRVDEQESDDDLVGRRNRGEAG